MTKLNLLSAALIAAAVLAAPAMARGSHVTVRAQDMGEPAGIAPLQRVQDSFVLLYGKHSMLRRHRCDSW
jgi:hypothetical protein